MGNTILKFGIHDFINAQPLLRPLREQAPDLGLEVICDAPANLADRLAAEELDLAMIPSIEYLRAADRYRLLPGWSISSRGPVNTVLLFCRNPLNEVRKVALDERSRTSAVLLRLLFGEAFHPEVRYSTQGVTEQVLQDHDAALVIGDRAFPWALQSNDTRYDLSREWFQRTGKTFVHAVVAVRQGVSLKVTVVEALKKIPSMDQGEVDKVANQQSEKTGIAASVLSDYLNNKIVYDLGANELEGLRLFQSMCCQKSFLDREREIRFVEE